MKKNSIFWIGYSDLMTSLFFIMLVLFVLTVAMLKRNLNASEEAIEKVNNVIEALNELDTNYYSFDEETMRYKLNIDIIFELSDDNIYAATDSRKRKDLIKAGKNLFSLISRVTKKNPNINYLLVIEGNTQRALLSNGWNYRTMPNLGYRLSYKRALALMNFWKAKSIDFSRIHNCEILICGSGYFGKSRDPMVSPTYDNSSNRKFTIQIAPKLGKIELKDEEK